MLPPCPKGLLAKVNSIPKPDCRVDEHPVCSPALSDSYANPSFQSVATDKAARVVSSVRFPIPFFAAQFVSWLVLLAFAPASSPKRYNEVEALKICEVFLVPIQKARATPRTELNSGFSNY